MYSIYYALMLYGLVISHVFPLNMVMVMVVVVADGGDGAPYHTQCL